jgi:signal transduction histidine kinase
VDPAEASMTPRAPPVRIESLVMDGEEVAREAWQPAGGRQGAAALRPPQAAVLRVPPGTRHFQFCYTGLCFSAPEQLHFQHKLDGVDAEWVDTGSQRETTYDRLAHGTYTFHVRAGNREGVWNHEGDAVTFAVLPYFWQTGWFTGLFLLVFGGAVGCAVGYALRGRHKRRLALLQKLNALEQERTRIARDIHDDLGGSLTEIGYLGALAVRDSHSLEEAREQLTNIMGRTRELARRLDETVWAVNPKNDSSGHVATYLCHFAREFFEPTDIRCRMDVAPDLPDAPLTTEVRHSVFLVVKEALNNAVKHSQAKEVCLSLWASGGALMIEVSDNGRGFGPDSKRDAGNGLRNMASRMEEIGGQFEVRSTPGHGTTVCLKLPLDEDRRNQKFRQA